MVPQYYLGTIVATKRKPGEYGDLLTQTPEFHEVVCDIPGVVTGVKAFPKSCAEDEPRVGDPVLLCSFDPTYNSYFVYEVLKETDFIGFRASGKMIDVTPGAITIGVYDENTEYKRGERPDCSALAHVTITSEGAVDIHTASNINVKADANITLNCAGNSSVTISKNCDLKVSGNCNVNVSGTLQTNGGTWRTNNGVAVPSGNGPFCGIPFCPFTGAPQSGQQC